MTRVLALADSQAALARLMGLLGSDRGLEVAGRVIAGDGLDPPSTGAGPDVLVVALSTEEPATALRYLARLAPPGGAPAVVLVENPSTVGGRDALAAGALAVLPLSSGAEELRAAVAAVAMGFAVTRPEDRRTRVGARTLPLPGTTPAAPRAPLTARELEVLRHLADGHGNRAIATRIGISERTVKFHLASIFEKLDVTSRTEAVTAGLRRGLIML